MRLDGDSVSASLPTTRGEALDQAIAWAVRLGAPDADDALRARFAAWHAAGPWPAQAWREVQGVDQAFAPLGGPAGHRAMAALHEVARPRRRNLLTAGFVAAGVALAGRLAWDGGSTRRLLTTAQRVRDRFVLDDGSVLQLNVDSRVALAFTPLRRVIALQQGELHLTTGADRRWLVQRSLHVTTAHATLTPLGTAFDVRLLPDATRLTVEHGRVAVRAGPGQAGGDPLMVEAGRSIDIGRTIVSIDRGFDASGWTDGALIVRGMRLDAFVAEWSRYAAAAIHCSPETAALHVSGVFQLDGPEPTGRAVDSLVATLGLKARRGRDGVLVLARA